MFVTFEGCEGVGKSTQIKLVKEYLELTGQDAIFIREPGGSDISEQIRRIILDTNNSNMADLTEAMLYASSRAQLVSEIILPALNQGKTVFCDRFVDSSVAYQGYARGLGADLIKRINEPALQGLMPDCTIFIDLSPANNFRQVKTNDRLEQESDDFHNKVYNGFLAEMGTSNGRIVGIKPDFNKMVTHSKILNTLRERGAIK